MNSNDSQYSLWEKILRAEPQANKSSRLLASEADIFTVQRKGVSQLLAENPELHVQDAKPLQQRLTVVAATLMRQFRQQRQLATFSQPPSERKGLRAWSGGPTYAGLFSPNWRAQCQSDDLGATSSPAAYLIDLLLFLTEHIESQGDEEQMIALLQRRPDLWELMLDEDTANREIPQIEIVNHVLERAITDDAIAREQPLTAVEDHLLSVRYPLKQFPYESYWQQIKTVLAHNDLLFCDVAPLSDIQQPTFIQPGAHTLRSDSALQQNSALGPVLRGLLTEPPWFNASSHRIRFDPYTRRVLSPESTKGERDLTSQAQADQQFFRDNFGVADFDQLQDVVKSRQILQMDKTEMASLFCLPPFAPSLSPHVQLPELMETESVSPARFGAVFINHGVEPAISIVRELKKREESEEPQRFEHLTELRCDRLNRLVRLAQTLNITYPQADRIVMAAITAEQRTMIGSKQRNDENNLWMTANTMRALGLFGFLRDRFGCQPEEFAVLLAEIGIFTLGDEPSQFDRLFNGEQYLDHPLVLDGAIFTLTGNDIESKRTVDQLCHGLQISLDTLRHLARTVMQGTRDDRLYRTPAIISSFYRIVLLARLLAITTTELLSLLEVMNPEGQYGLELAGQPHNVMYQNYQQADAVSVIYAVSHCVQWCRQQDIAVSWLIQQLLPISASKTVSEQEQQLFKTLNNSLLPILFTDDRLIQATVPPLLNQASWKSKLNSLIDPNGLVKGVSELEQDIDAESYQQFASREVSRVISELIKDDLLPEYSSDEQQRLKDIIIGVLLSVRTLQWGVLQELFSTDLDLDAKLVIPVVYWAGGSVYTLLLQAIQGDSEQTLSAILPLVYRMRRYAGIAKQFSLSSKMLSAFLPRRQQSWFSITTPQVTLTTFYFLAQYAQIFKDRPKEDQLLDYLLLINSLPPLEEMSANERLLITDAAAEKLAAWLGWGIREVLDVARQMTEDGVIRHLAQIVTLAQCKQLADKTGLSAVSLVNISSLTPYDDVYRYRSVAEEALSSLKRTPSLQRYSDDSELRQSITTKCQVDKTRLIAQSPDEIATVSMRLLSMDNQPLAGITVTWSTDVGIILDSQSVSDEQGYATTRLQAGKRMGSAHVQARYLLEEIAHAPPVMIDCDENTLILWQESDNPQSPWELAGEQGEYKLLVLLVDERTNPGIDRPIKWATSIGRFVGSSGETLTDAQGYSEVRLRSYQAGSGEVTVWYESGSSVTTIPVTFVNQPIISSLSLLTPAIVDDEIRVGVLILGLDSQPQAGVALTWSATGATLLTQEDSSNESGEAFATLQADAVGVGSITVTIGDGNGAAEGQCQTVTFNILGAVQLVNPQHDGYYPLADGEQYSEYRISVHSDNGEPVANYPVAWSVIEHSDEPIILLTNLQGEAIYQFRPEKAGDYTIKASLEKDQQSHTFEPITAYPSLDLEVLLDGKPLTVNGIELWQGESYQLTFRIANGHPLLTENVQLLFNGRDAASALELIFTPELGAHNTFSGNEASWQITCGDTNPLSNAAYFQLSLAYPHVKPAYLPSREGILRPKN